MVSLSLLCNSDCMSETFPEKSPLQIFIFTFSHSLCTCTFELLKIMASAFQHCGNVCYLMGIISMWIYFRKSEFSKIVLQIRYFKEF